MTEKSTTVVAEPSKAMVPFEQVRSALAPYPKERFHHLLPSSFIGLSPLYIPTPVVVVVDPNDERDVYRKPGTREGSDEVCFHATALNRIANASGLDFDPRFTIHRHDRKNEPYVCEQIVGGYYTDSLGQRRTITSAITTHDLRDGSPRAKIAASPKQLEVSRQFICEQCGARARSNAIRKTVEIQSSYKKSELMYVEQLEGGKTRTQIKPFVALRFRLDESDPDVKKAVIARGIGSADEVYGRREPELVEAPPVGKDAGEDIEGDFTEATTTPAAAAAAAPEDDEPGVGAAPLSTEEKAAADVDRMGEIHAGYQILRENLAFEGKPWSAAARTKPVTSQQWVMVGQSVLEAVATPGLSEEQKRTVRHAVVAFLRGPIDKWSDVTNEQASAAIEWAKAKPGEVREVFAFLLERKDDLAGIREQLRAQLRHEAA